MFEPAVTAPRSADILVFPVRAPQGDIATRLHSGAELARLHPVRASLAADPALRLRTALASLEAALAAQRLALADWRGALLDLHGSLGGLGTSLQGYNTALAGLAQDVTVLNEQAHMLEAIADTAP